MARLTSARNMSRTYLTRVLIRIAQHMSRHEYHTQGALASARDAAAADAEALRNKVATELAEAEAGGAILRDAVELLRSELDAAHAASGRLRSELAEANVRSASDSALHRELRVALDAAQRDASEAAAESHGLRDELEAASTESQRLCGELAAARDVAAQHVAKVSEHAATIGELRAALDARSASDGNVHSRLAEAAAELRAREATVERMKGAEERARAEALEASERFDELETLLSAKSGRISHLEQENAELKARLR